MDPSTLSTTGAELYESVAPLMSQDADYGYPGAVLAGAFAKMLDPVAALVRDQADGTPGWAIVFQPDNPDLDPAWLPWVAQFTGDAQAVMAAPTTAAKVALLQNPVNFATGLPSTIQSTVKGFLTGTQRVFYNSRYNGAFTLEIGTLDTETPADPTAMQQAVRAATPAWIVVTFTTVTSGTYSALDSAHTTYSALEAAHTSYADLEQNPSA